MRTRKMLSVRVVDLPTRPITIYKNGEYGKLPDNLKQFNDAFYPIRLNRYSERYGSEDFIILPNRYSYDPSFKLGEFKGGLYAIVQTLYNVSNKQ